MPGDHLMVIANYFGGNFYLYAVAIEEQCFGCNEWEITSNKQNYLVLKLSHSTRLDKVMVLFVTYRPLYFS